MCAYEKGRGIAKQMLIAKMLIDAGVDVNVQNSVGSTALHVSAYENDLELTKMLLDAGADKTISNDVGLPYEIADNQELKELLQP
jgi:ankyrin repeat protein